MGYEDGGAAGVVGVCQQESQRWNSTVLEYS